MNPHDTTREFERALCEYTGAKYAVTTNSCTNALLIACAWLEYERGSVHMEIPRYTYVSVPQSIITAGHTVGFLDEDWIGEYQLRPFNIWDSARRFTSGMFRPGQMQCVSFHISKILGLDQGGAVLHDNDEADAWLRRARFDGRASGVEPKDDTFTRGFHCYLSPTIAAQGLWRLSFLPKHNADLPNSDYPDLSKVPLFQSQDGRLRGNLRALLRSAPVASTEALKMKNEPAERLVKMGQMPSGYRLIAPNY